MRAADFRSKRYLASESLECLNRNNLSSAFHTVYTTAETASAFWLGNHYDTSQPNSSLQPTALSLRFSAFEAFETLSWSSVSVLAGLRLKLGGWAANNFNLSSSSKRLHLYATISLVTTKRRRQSMEKPWSQLSAVELSPDKVSGALVFRGTRVPVAALFENLRDGASIDQFLSWFPGVERADVEAVLDYEVNLFTSVQAV